MKRSDLKTGMKVVTREGLQYIVLRNIKSTYTDEFAEYYTEELLFVAPQQHSYSWWSGKDLTDDLFNDHNWDIMEVLVPNHPYDVFYHHEGFTSIWKRETKTPEQKQLQEVVDKISDPQKQAEILQGMVGK